MFNWQKVFKGMGYSCLYKKNGEQGTTKWDFSKEKKLAQITFLQFKSFEIS